MKEMICSFCGRSSREVAMLPGVDANICVDCVKRANEMIDEHLRQVHSVPVGIEATQTPVSTAPKAKRKQKNPFVDADWK